MGERAFVNEATGSLTADTALEFEQPETREDLLDRFANTPMAYMVKGVMRYASGSYDAMQLCEYLQSEDLTVRFLRRKFEEAEDNAKEFPEKPAEDPTPIDKNISMVDSAAEKPEVTKLVSDQKVESSTESPKRQDVQKPTQQEPVAQPVEDIITATVVSKNQPTQEVINATAEPVISVLNHDVTETASSSVAERSEATKSHSREDVTAPVERELVGVDYNQDARTPNLDRQPENVVIEKSEVGEPETTREVLVANAVQAVYEVIEEQRAEQNEVSHDGDFSAPTVLELVERPAAEDAALPESSTALEVVDTSPGVTDVQPKPDVVHEAEPVTAEEDSLNGYEIASEDETDAPIKVADEYSDDVVEHVRTLTAILEAEQSAETEDSNEVTEPTISSEPAALDIAAIQEVDESLVPEIFASDILDERGISSLEEMPEDEIRKAIYETSTVIERIDALASARTELECREAVEALRQELATLLGMLGHPDAVARANELLKLWQHDLESLKQYITRLQKSLLATQIATKQAQLANVKPIHWRYGANAVRLVVSLVKNPSDQQHVLAA